VPLRVALIQEFAAERWRTIALAIVFGLGLAFLYSYWRKSEGLQRWRREQEAQTQIELIALRALRQSKSTDPMAMATIERLKRSGELVEPRDADRTSIEPTPSTNMVAAAKGQAPKILWTQEPGGFQRLRYTWNFDEDASTRNELTLTRRYPNSVLPSLTVLDGLVASLVFAVSVLGVLSSSMVRFQRRCLEQSIASWASQMAKEPQESLPSMPDLNMPDHPKIAQSLVTVSEAIRERVLQTQNSVQQTSRVMSAMPIGVLAFDPMFQLLFVNRAGIELLGLSPSVLFGQPLMEVVRQPTVVELVQRVATELEPQEADLELPDRKLSLRLRGLPWSSTAGDESAPPSILLAITDETRLKQLENARRDFTANVSHELKTPLSAIKAYAETLLMGALEDEQASHLFVERIGEQANRLDMLIRDLLHLTRLQSQPEKPPMDDLDLNDVLKTCVEEHATIGKSRNITIDVSGIPASIRVFSNLESLRTVLGNLLSNAVRYNHEGGWVKVTTAVEGDVVRLCVEDNGIGIPTGDLDRIFERFYRVEKARSQDFGGTGLGLSIVKHLVQSMSAEISVRSVLGQGSCFELRLPRGEDRLSSQEKD
jgi:two-component system phosphate regulon sensor histidine kinase PhoR